MLALAIPGIPSSDHPQQASQSTSFNLSPSFLCLILKYVQIRKDRQVVKQSPRDEKESPPKQKHNFGENPENKKQQKVSKSLSLVAMGKCKRLSHPLKKKVLWRKNRHRIKLKVCGLKSLNPIRR